MNNYQIIVIIGLPGSGKTRFSESFENYILYDDFVTHFYNGQLMNDIKAGKQVCINDPRLCIFDIFTKYMDILTKYVDVDKIFLFLYENDSQQCLVNVEKNVSNTILEYSKLYDLSNYYSWNHKIIQVYSDTNLYRSKKF